MRRGSFFVSAKLAPGVHDGDNGLLARNLRAGRKGAVDGGDEPLALSGYCLLYTSDAADD